MKKFIIATLISAVALFAMPNNELELVLAAKAAEKKAVVLATMQLQGDTKEKFGNLYDEYQVKLFEQKLKEFDLISQYAEHYANLTDAQADKLIDTWVSQKEDAMVLDKNYIAKFKKILSSADVIRYFQIEHRLGLVQEVEKASVIPLAQPTLQTPSK
jgi:hypothetical protein